MMDVSTVKARIFKEKYTIIAIAALLAIIGIQLGKYVKTEPVNEGLVKLEESGIPATQDQLFVHIAGNDPTIVEWLLMAGVDPNGMNNEGYTPLAVAAMTENRADIIRVLGKYGANPQQLNAANNWPALFHAIGKDNGNVEALLEIGADPNHLTADYISPLYLATKSRSYDTITSLLKAGADVNLHNEHGVNIPLYVAVQDAVNEGDNTMALFLISVGADPFALENTEDGPRIAVGIRGVEGNLEEELRKAMIKWDNKQQP